MDGADEAAVDIGRVIQDLGWRQCSIFKPDEAYELPEHLSFDRNDEWLAIATQSCSLCGQGASAEPMVEVIVAKQLPAYDAQHGCAKGKVVRFLHLPITGLPGCDALEFDIGRRAFLPRDLFAAWNPSKVELAPRKVMNGLSKIHSGISAEDEMTSGSVDFQAWISRYYARIDIPDTLGKRLRKGGAKSVFTRVEKVLKQTLTRKSEQYVVHTDVGAMYISWAPEAELPGDQNYTVHFLIACGTAKTLNHMLEQLGDMASGVAGKQIPNGIVMSSPEVKLMDDVTIMDVSGMRRFSEWDDLSSPADIIKIISNG